MMKEFNQDEEEREHEAAKEEENQEEEEANKAVAPKIPVKPSQEEVDAHVNALAISVMVPTLCSR